ncbi:putative isochorismatase family protein [Phaeobacter piscinae]|uniref:Isochorismatase family protein n=1 Tax=Phaeobacter piscinae TaxID=1580596 RepID=A0ABM6PDW8_9RHOB|nr:cysteine hydrolase family protein [Phaeobacter piscinae]ATG35918.1 putative isochorismatase family protein [Phaeobacter piscinae]AUQ86439.1 putative isochorismatase family protein [Phaeobacter piscinae]AUR24322.1 putative isochorismatase family protein [Phaeobacter piscinae]
MTKSALLLIDIQNDYFPSFDGSKMPLPNMDAAVENAADLLATARDAGLKVIHVRHLMATDAAPFFHPESEGAEIHHRVSPKAGEGIVEKSRPNSFVGTNLEPLLRKAQIGHLVICGAMSQMCIDATVRGGVDLGFKVTVAQDACAAANVLHDDVSVPAAMVHAAIMAPLAASYADVRPTSEIKPTIPS